MKFTRGKREKIIQLADVLSSDIKCPQSVRLYLDIPLGTFICSAMSET